MRTIFISAGHSNVVGKDRGAFGNGYIEGVLTVELRDLIVKELKSLGGKVVVDSNDSILAQTMALFKNKTTKDCILLDIHWNAATPQATGTEVIIPTTPTNFEKELALKLSDIISKTLKIRNRGILTEDRTPRKSLGWMRLIGENILIETCFISNKKDMDNYQQNKIILSKLIAKNLFEFANKNTQNNRIYIVKSGDTLSKIAKFNNTDVNKIIIDNNLKTHILQINQQIKL